MNLVIAAYFSAENYPEFTEWKPVMDERSAEKYVATSAIKTNLFHETFPLKATNIHSMGMNINFSTPTVEFAAGHYMAVHADYVTDRFGSVIVRHKALIKRPFFVTGKREFEYWQEKMGLHKYAWNLRPRLSTLELLEQGFDGMHIAQDTVGVEHSESWLAFYPMQVVSLV